MQKSAQVKSDCVKEKLCDSKSIFRPRKVMNNMRLSYGVSVSYEKAWRGKEAAT